MYGLVLVIHILVSLVLIGVILLQGGRGGLSEALGGAAAQSLFGGGAATVLTRITAFCAGAFVVTCLSLAYLSTVKGRSVVEQIPVVNPNVLLPLPSAQPPSSSNLPVLPAAVQPQTAPPATPASPTPSQPVATPRPTAPAGAGANKQAGQTTSAPQSGTRQPAESGAKTTQPPGTNPSK